MKTDKLFFRLFQNWPELALTLLQLPYAGSSYKFTSEELKETSFTLDGVFKPLDSNLEQPLIFTEVQFQADPEFYGRLFSEIYLYLYQYKPKRPWLALVIYPNRAIEKPPAIEYTSTLNLPEVQCIYLEDYQQRLEPEYALLRLIVSSEDDTVGMAQEMLTKTAEKDNNIIEFIETVLVYKLPHLTRNEIKAMMNLNNIELKQTRFYQEIAEEERQEGQKEGRLEGQKEVFLLLLEAKFGKVDRDLQTKVNQATVKQIENWTKQILQIDSVEVLLNS